MNIGQIEELLRLLREINERLARIEGICQDAGIEWQKARRLADDRYVALKEP